MKQKIKDIQILRAVAILFVLLQHFDLVHVFAYQLPIYVIPPFSQAVRLFFVISGYVVARSLFSGNEVKPFQFIVKRLFRIYPLLILFLGFTALTNWFLRTPLAGRLNSTIAESDKLPWSQFWDLTFRTLTGTYINTGKFEQIPLFGAMWSLSIEFQFYGLIALLILLLTIIFRRKKFFIEYFLLIFCLIFYGISLANRISILLSGNFLFQYHLFTYIVNWSFDFVFLGFALAIAEKKGWLFHFKFLKFSRDQALFLAPLLIVIPLILSALTRSDNMRLFMGLSSPLTAIMYALLVYLAATIGCFPGTESRTYKSLYWIGQTSYSIYLFHIPIKSLVMISYGAIFPPVAIVWDYYFQGIYQIILMTVSVFPLVYFLYYKFEVPLIDYSYQLISKKKNKSVRTENKILP